MSNLSPKSQTGTNARALILAQLARFTISMGGTTVLSRLLSPDFFGLAAIVMAVVNIAGILGDLGLSVVAIRKMELSHKQWSGLFWANAGLGGLIAAVVAGISPMVGRFYNDPRVTPLLLAISSVFLLNGISVQYRVSLNREGRFARLAIIETLAPAIALVVAIVLAIVHPSPWALIAQAIVAPALLLLFSVVSAPQLPNRPTRNSGVRSLLVSGGVLSASQVIYAIKSNVGPLALGRFVPDATVGMFSRAMQLSTMPHMQLAAPLTRVTVPALSASAETTDFEHQVLKARAIYGYTVGVALALLGGLAVPMVRIMLGPQWMENTPTILAIATFGALFQSISYIFYWVLTATDQTKYIIRAEGLTGVLVILGIIIFARYGPTMIAWVYAAGLVVNAFAYSLYVLPRIGLSISHFFASAIPNLLVLSLILGGNLLIIRYLPVETSLTGYFLQIGVGLLWAAAILLIASLAIPRVRNDLQQTFIAVKRIAGIKK